MSDIEERVFVQLKKDLDYKEIFTKIEKNMNKFMPKYNWNELMDYSSEGCMQLHGFSFEYNDLLEIISVIYKVIKGKGFILSDYYDNAGDESAAIIYLGKDIKEITTLDAIYQIDIAETKKWLEMSKDFMLIAEEIRYYKKITGVKLAVNPFIIERTVILSDKVGVMEYGLNNKDIVNVDTIENIDLFIDDMGFFACPQLKKVDFSKCRNIYISVSAFEGCDQLSELILPKSGKIYISNTAFDYTPIDISKLSNVEIFDNNKAGENRKIWNSINEKQ